MHPARWKRRKKGSVCYLSVVRDPTKNTSRARKFPLGVLRGPTALTFPRAAVARRRTRRASEPSSVSAPPLGRARAHFGRDGSEVASRVSVSCILSQVGSVTKTYGRIATERRSGDGRDGARSPRARGRAVLGARRSVVRSEQRHCNPDESSSSFQTLFVSPRRF